ncbi:hypothetical protein FB192DRAFT_1352944 [Mucor lusitanicus]|uniref:Uncharacterized protein n=1 Tax=Mucor circinelloides f. lusitanicus TaxID=29924 RepID=A0A8H4F848_MUCCL|nr:hypothetical protein FB192DRAFT_1352944 [Mucor lusitanicus]
MLKSLTNIGVCVGVVFGTAATLIGHKQNQPLRYTAASIVALIGKENYVARVAYQRDSIAENRHTGTAGKIKRKKPAIPTAALKSLKLSATIHLQLHLNTYTTQCPQSMHLTHPLPPSSLLLYHTHIPLYATSARRINSLTAQQPRIKGSMV